MAKQLIFALFPDEAAAKTAADALQAWDKAETHISLDKVGVLTIDKNGKLKSSIPGRVATAAKGAGAGVIITVLVGTLHRRAALPARRGRRARAPSPARAWACRPRIVRD